MPFLRFVSEGWTKNPGKGEGVKEDGEVQGVLRVRRQEGGGGSPELQETRRNLEEP